MLKSRIKTKLQDNLPTKRAIKTRLRRMERLSLQHAHKYIVQRITTLRAARRHIIAWLVLVSLLSGIAFWQVTASSSHFMTDVPVEGGVFTEGTFGAVDNLNPIFAATSAERSISRLVFANLLTYDNSGDLVGELAAHWAPQDDGRAYTLSLRPNAYWHDGQAITADDILFTFQLIKNADTRSPLYSSWRNIGIEKVDNLTVRFLLPAPYAAFPNSLVIGMLPKHVLKDVAPSELRTEPFNRAPTVGSGAFEFQDLRAADAAKNHYIASLRANTGYILGQPKLSGIQLHAYKDREELSRALRSQEVAAASDLTSTELKSIEGNDSFVQINAPLYNGVYAFLKMDSPKLNDKRVRQALQLATDHNAILGLYGGTVQNLDGPLIAGQLGYRNDTRQPSPNLQKAAKLLDEAGWKMSGQGNRRVKDGQPLKLQLATVSSGNYPALAEEIMLEWRKIGVEFDTNLVKADDIQQNVILPRSYDVLLYEVVIGRDSDVFAYWQSSQATERGFNLSNYKSSKVDEALDSARSRFDPALRDAKYHLFAQQWLNDIPAIALYRPTLTYVQNKNSVTFAAHPLVEPTDRYFNVRYWAVGTEPMRDTR
jgi:peptide/nickel transport system substrate-binding protein